MFRPLIRVFDHYGQIFEEKISFLKPTAQRVCNSNHVAEIKTYLKENAKRQNGQGLLTVLTGAFLETDPTKIYILDGQHRQAALFEYWKENPQECISFEIAVYLKRSEYEINRFYDFIQRGLPITAFERDVSENYISCSNDEAIHKRKKQGDLASSVISTHPYNMVFISHVNAKRPKIYSQDWLNKFVDSVWCEEIKSESDLRVALSFISEHSRIHIPVGSKRTSLAMHDKCRDKLGGIYIGIDKDQEYFRDDWNGLSEMLKRIETSRNPFNT